MRVASWRYERGCRSLAANLNAGDVPKSVPQSQQAPPADDLQDDVDVPAEIEDVIEKLMQGLRDPNTIVRFVTVN